MHGVPRDLDLSGFVGKALVQVCLGEFQVSFNFECGHLISVEGRWEVLDPQGVMLDHSRENAERDAYRVHRLLGRSGRLLLRAAPGKAHHHSARKQWSA